MANGPATVSDQVQAMRRESQRVHDLIQGGPHMRSRGEVYLPKFPLESKDAYQARVDMTWLFNGVKKVRDDWAARIFEKPVTLNDPDTALGALCQNVDGEGRDLSNFAKDLFEASLERGIAFIFVDAPRRPEGELTRGQVAELGLRPHMSILTLDEVLGWKSELIANAPVLTQFRISETIADPERGEFDDDTIEQVRVLSLIEGRVYVRIYRKNDKGEFGLFDEYPTDMTQISVVPVYTGRTGYFTAKTPLDDIAELNIAHWQRQSDASNCQHQTLTPMIHFKGMDVEQQAANGAGYAFASDNPDATIEIAEVAGTGLASAKVELDEIKDQMRQAGMQIIAERTGVTTATGESSDEKKSVTRIRMMADDLKDSLEIALGMMNDMAGIDDSTEVSVHTEFGSLDGLPMDEVRNMYLDGVISREAYFNEGKRRGIIHESVEYTDDLEATEREGLDSER